MGLHVVQNKADSKAHKAIDLAHPLRVVFGEVIVYSNDVNALPRKRIQVCGDGGGQGFSFAGSHLSDSALMHDGCAHKLHAERSLTQHASGRFADGSKSLRHQFVQRLALIQALSEKRGLISKVCIGKRLHLLFQRVHLVGNLHKLLDLGLVRPGKNLLYKLKHSFHEYKSPNEMSIGLL